MQDTTNSEADAANLSFSEHVTAPPSAPLSSTPERRQLTVLSCSLADASYLLNRLDADDLHIVMRAFHTLCADTVVPYGGLVAQRFDNGCLVYFGYPQAHDDDARRAVLAGLHLLEGLRTGLPELGAWMKGTAGLKIGIHTGEVVVDAIDDGASPGALVVGTTATLASVLRDLAAPRTVLISADTARLVEGYVTRQALTPVTLPGQSDAMALYQVTGDSGAQMRLDTVPARKLTPFVGREAELALLNARWAQTCDGRGQAVVVSGEAGIGKSRLARLLAELLTPGGCTILEGRGSPYHQQSAFYPLTEVLCRVLRLDEHLQAEDPVSQCEAALQRYGLDIQRHLPFVAPLLNLPLPSERDEISRLSPQQKRQRTFESLTALVLALSEEQPLLFTLEDLHWIDPSTLAWLDLLLDQIPTAAILLLLTCRPEFQVPWHSRSHITQVTLDRLEMQQSRRMVESIVWDRAFLTSIIHQIVAHSDGVPLFVEELSRAVLDSGLADQVPMTLQDTLMARLDQVGEAKRTAQLGAVIGRQFGDSLIRAVSPLDEEVLAQDLRCLVGSELLYRRGVGSDAVYRFKHALIQDVAHHSLLRRTRQQLHQQIAQVLEAKFPETKAAQPGLLAHHYTEAGLYEQAVGYWQQAGQRSNKHSAYAEAVAHLTTGLEVLKALPDTPRRAKIELTLQIILGPALIVTKGYGASEVARAYIRAQELCQQLGDNAQLATVLNGLFLQYFVQAEHRTARGICDRLLALASQQEDKNFKLIAYVASGASSVLLGELVMAHRHTDQVIALYNPREHLSLVSLHGPHPGVMGYRYSALASWALGYPAQAQQRCLRALSLARENGHVLTQASEFCFAAMIAQYCREVDNVYERAEVTIRLATEQGFPHWLAWGKMMQGWALAFRGQGDEGIAQIRENLMTCRSAGGELFTPYVLALLTEAYMHTGRPTLGLTALAEALVQVDKTDERHWEAELHRLKGLLLLQLSSDNQEEAETCFNQALNVARRQHAKSLELRAATSLACLWQQQGKYHDAYNLLAPVHGWFTEGFDTPDLYDAKGLLNEFSAVPAARVLP